MNQKKYWNDVSETKQFTTPFQADAFEHLIPKDAKILDVGCGYGRTLNELYELGYRDLMGIDFSSGMIERGKKQFPHLNLQIKTAETISLPDHSMDAVILFAVLTCIPEDTAQEQLISEIHRVLKPGGIIYINDFLLNKDERNLKRYQEFESLTGTYGVFKLPEGAILRHHSEDHVHDLLHNFETITYERLTFKTMNGHISNGFFYFGKSL